MLRYYKEGQHGGGFVGYRVAVSWAGKRHQKYFSISKYGARKAKALANQTHEGWLDKAEKTVRTHKIPKKLFHKFAKGMTASAHHKDGFSYITLSVYNHDQSDKLSIGIHFDDYQDVYQEALTWLKANRNDYDPPERFPYTWTQFIALLGLKGVRRQIEGLELHKI